jgi:hypothetical protein
MVYMCLGISLWLLYVTWGGVMPNGHTVRGKNEAGQKMRPGQRILFGVGGLLFLGLAFVFFRFH